MLVTVLPADQAEADATKMSLDTGVAFPNVIAGVVFTADGRSHMFPPVVDGSFMLTNLEFVRDNIKAAIRQQIAQQQQSKLAIPFPMNGR